MSHHRSARHSRQLEKNFAEIGSALPRVAVTVDLLSTGYDAPDVKNIVFVRPIRSSILYKQMKGRGTDFVKASISATLLSLTILVPRLWKIQNSTGIRLTFRKAQNRLSKKLPKEIRV